jgi:hypothetical protein
MDLATSAALLCTLFLTRLVLLAILPVLRFANRILEKQKIMMRTRLAFISELRTPSALGGEITPLGSFVIS